MKLRKNNLSSVVWRLRIDGQLLWKGEAERADGDLVAIDVKNIALERLMDLSTNNITIAGPVSGKIYKHYRHP